MNESSLSYLFITYLIHIDATEKLVNHFRSYNIQLINVIFKVINAVKLLNFRLLCI